MRCYFQILNISYKDCVINDKVFTKIQHAIRPPEDHKEMQTEVVWTCLPFIRSSQHYLARHSERRKKTRQIEKGLGRQHQGMDRHGVRQVSENSGEQSKMEETGCDAQTTPVVKG